MRRASHTRCGRWVLVLAAALFAPAGGVFAQAAGERRTVSVSDPARPITLDVRLTRGSVEVVAEDRRDVVVESLPISPGRSSASAAQAAAVDIQAQHNVVTVVSRTDRVDIRVQVPRRANIKLHKSGTARPVASAGAVTIRGVEGDLEIQTVAGAINLIDIAGSIVAHSRLSDLVVTLTRVDAEQPMAFTSYSGNVDVTLPADVKADVILASHRQGVFTDFDLRFDGALPATSPLTGRGYRRLGNQPIRARVNGGGPEFELRSYSGAIYLRKGH